MSTRDRLENEAISTFTSTHPGWTRVAEGDALATLEKTFSFKDYGAGLAFAIRVAFAAEKRDHHPDLLIQWGKVKVAWSTHDAGGITQLDTEMADATDRLYTSG